MLLTLFMVQVIWIIITLLNILFIHGSSLVVMAEGMIMVCLIT